jgi:RNA polymerase sigma factor (TIGR02999 family)
VSIPELLDAVRAGTPGALDRLYTALYGDLRRLAHERLRKQRAPSLLGTTVLVHESYLRLMRSGSLPVEHRAQFLAYATRSMRSVIVDTIRERRADRRGDGAAHLPLDTAIPITTDPREEEILGVHDALERLGEVDPRVAQVVEMKYFGGLNEAEVADALGIGVRTVARDWEKARLFLAQALA